MKDIEIYVGLHTDLVIDLTQVDWSGISYILFTIKNLASVDEPVIVERDLLPLDKPEEAHKITITPDESIALQKGAVYDLTEVREDGTTYPASKDMGRVILIQRAGGRRGNQS